MFFPHHHFHHLKNIGCKIALSENVLASIAASAFFMAITEFAQPSLQNLFHFAQINVEL
jgi:hypothetical protein